mgnify:CR=1 FL=1|jgi:hypothetical protein
MKINKTMKTYKMLLFLMIITMMSVSVFAELDEVLFEIVTPTDRTYNETNIALEIISNVTLDNITYQINNEDLVLGCEICNFANETLDLEEGNYTISAYGYLNEESIDDSVDFTVQLSDHDYTNEEEQSSRFTTGLNKLPQMLTNGEITDEELAEIISSNLLNPGIINRLIKTGMLGNKSIDAIIDTQSTPPGIFRKIFSFFGFGNPTFAESIYEDYNLSENTKQKMLEKDLLPKKEMNEIKKEMKVNFQSKIQKQNKNRMNDYVNEESENDDNENDNDVLDETDVSHKISNNGNNNGNKNENNGNQNGLENQAKNENQKVTHQPPGLEKKSEKVYDAGKQNGNSKFNQQDETEIVEKGNSGNAKSNNNQGNDNINQGNGNNNQGKKK